MLNSVINSLARIAKQFDSSCPDTSDDVDSDFFLPWLRMDSGREFAGQMLNIARFVDAATIRAKGDGWIGLEGMIVKPQKTGYGRFIRIGGVKAWFGIHIGGWARYSDTPLWLRFDYHERERLASLTNDVFEIDWRYYIPIALPSTLDDEAVLDSVVDSPKKHRRSTQGHKHLTTCTAPVQRSLPCAFQRENCLLPFWLNLRKPPRKVTVFPMFGSPP